MKRLFLALALVFGSGASWSHATVSVELGQAVAGSDGSGASFGYFRIEDVIPYGGSVTLTYDYSIDVHIDGLPADRTWDYCLPVSGTWCGPAPTGREQVEVDFTVGEAPEMSHLVSWGVSGLPSIQLFTAPGDYTLSGVVTVVGTRDSFDDAWSPDDNVSLGIGTFDDSSDLAAVPEAPTLAMLLAGGVLMLRRRVRP